MWSTIGHVAGTRAKIGFAMPRVDLDHTRSDLGLVLVGRTRFELVTSSVSGKRSPAELTARVPRRDATRARTPPRAANGQADPCEPSQDPQADDSRLAGRPQTPQETSR